ncbi:MAG: NUDIX domain-containing protein [Minisyncoccia bacterium]
MKLISLNLEGHKHFDRQLPFFKSEEPDALCLQEVFEPDVLALKRELGFTGAFAPMMLKPYPSLQTGTQTPLGVAVLSRYPLLRAEPHYYVGSAEQVAPFVGNGWDTVQRVLLSVDLDVPDGRYCVGTVHFTWTPNGKPNDTQRADLLKLLLVLEQFPNIVFCGDFNASRGGEIFSELAARYMDHIPARFTTSIDAALHRAGALPYMVDGLFSTPQYRAENVCLTNGVSDHCAVVADLSTAPVPRESAGGVVMNPEGKIVVVSQHGDSWSLPKGHIDEGESTLEAARREIREESGITDITLIGELGSYERYRIGRGGRGEDESELKSITMFLFKTSQRELAPSDPENPQARWVSPEKALTMLTHPKDREFLDGIRDKLHDGTSPKTT